ncbi:HAMP domain-containing histidine kinase, partial [Flavobacteriales bacterium]|nr:HAMP domain-containing histidine kinase [Flavobacteriales bacterium]
PILITAISIAIVGLIIVQISWINSAITLKQDEFTRNVSETLRIVVDKLEKDEALSRLRSHQEGRFLFIDEDSIGHVSKSLEDMTAALDNMGGELDTLYEHIVIKEILKEEDQIQIKMIEADGNRQVTKHISAQSDEAKWTQEEEEIIRENVDLKLAYIQSAKEGVNTHQELNVDSLLKSRMVNKTAFVGDIVKRLMEVNLFEKIEDRINLQELDSLLTLELANKGITTNFEFGIYPPEEEAALVSSDKHKEKLKLSSLKTKLFPNDVVDSNTYLKLFFPKEKSFLIHQIWWMLCSSIFIIIAIIVVFVTAIRTIISQKEVSEIKNDFINNMTHELKTPISTISLACEALSDHSIAEVPGMSSRYVKMIDEENKRLGLLVESVLQSAILDKGNLKLKIESIDLNQLAEGVAKKLEMQVNKKGGAISLQLEASDAQRDVDKVHMINVVSNLIDNAIKYSEGAPSITVRTKSTGDDFILIVSDKGMGITSDNQDKIFNKLYRVPTGNLHNIKGFGLGLSYVKIIIERLGGSVSVASTVGAGSSFTIKIPKNYE